jgi:hypothetical protein
MATARVMDLVMEAMSTTVSRSIAAAVPSVRAPYAAVRRVTHAM